MTQINLCTQQKETRGRSEWICGDKGKGLGEGRIESLGLADANRYI